MQEAIFPDDCGNVTGNCRLSCYLKTMVKTLELALAKAAALPEAAQEQLGLEMLERIHDLEELRAEIKIGVRELDAGLGRELDIDELLKSLHAEHAAKNK